jgi:hypothetical protein
VGVVHDITINGSLATSGTVPSGPSASNPVRVGGEASATVAFSGIIAEILIWNRPLTTVEINKVEIFA